MDVDLMRKIDYWVGIPLCFFFSIINSAAKIFSFSRQKKIKKILFIELSEMGSTVFAYSSMKKAKEMYPDSELYFMIFRENQESVNLLKIIPPENIITIRSKSFPALAIDTVKAIFRMRREKIDVAIDLELFSRFTALLTYLSGASRRVGFHRHHMEGLYRGNLLTHKVAYNPHQHISHSFLSLIYALKSPQNEIPLTKVRISPEDIVIPQIKSSKEEKENILKKLREINLKISDRKKIVLLNPNASKLIPIRKWPLHNYVELARKLLLNKDVFIVITGISDEKPDSQTICNAVRSERCIDFTGKTANLRELIDLYNISRMLITNDSGPAHFASLTPIKIAVFFGPETPEIYRPLSRNCTVFYSHFACSPCVSAFNHRKTGCDNNKCLKAIIPNKVYDDVKKELCK